MLGRERLLKTLTGQDVDRMPVAPFIHLNFVRSFFKDADVDGPAATVDVYKHFGFDLIHRNCTPAYDDFAVPGPNWDVQQTTEKDAEGETLTTIITTPGGQLKQVVRTNWVTRFDAEASPTEYLIKEEADLDLVIKYQPPVPHFDTSLITRAKELVGEDGITAPWVQGAFNHIAYFVCPPDKIMLDAMLNPDFYHRLMSYFMERNKEITSRFIEAGADCLSYAANIASGKMVGPDFYREFILNYEKELVGHIQSQGAHVIHHNCGYGKNLLPIYNELGVHMHESLTPPPFGDTTLEYAIETLSPDIAISGNLDQIDFLMVATPDQVREKTLELVNKVKNRKGFILAASDYFHEDTPLENIAAIAEAAIS